MPSIAVKRRQLHHPEARPTIGDFAVGRLARKLAMEGPPISVDRYRCEAESAPIPATIRNSTLLLPAIPKMLPCSIRACPKILPAPWIGRSHYNMLKSFENSASEDRLSLQFLKISLQIGKCREMGRETVSLLTASSARQTALRWQERNMRKTKKRESAPARLSYPSQGASRSCRIDQNATADLKLAA